MTILTGFSGMFLPSQGLQQFEWLIMRYPRRRQRCRSQSPAPRRCRRCRSTPVCTMHKFIFGIRYAVRDKGTLFWFQRDLNQFAWNAQPLTQSLVTHSLIEQIANNYPWLQPCTWMEPLWSGLPILASVSSRILWSTSNILSGRRGEEVQW